MAETSRFWGGTVTGDATAAPYDDDEFSDVLRDLITADRATECVIRTNLASYSGLLAVTNPSGTTVRVASGVGFVDGKIYYNNANIDFTAGVSGKYYRVVLRKSFAAQTVRAVLLGPSGSTPSLTQTDAATWEVPLATIYNSSGVLSITDERVYVNRVLSGMYASGSIATADIADDAITDTKIGARVPQFYRRQGGDASDWSVHGSGNYTPTNVRIQAGVSLVPMTNFGTYYAGTVAITYPVPFSNKPIVFVTANSIQQGIQAEIPTVGVDSGSPQSSTGFTAFVYSYDASSLVLEWRISWMAIGPE